MAFLLGVAVAGLSAESSEESFGQAVQQSLERSRQAFPELTEPGSPLSEAVLVRIDWISRNKPGYFSDATWPEIVASAEAARLGIRPRATPAAGEPSGRYLAVVTKSFRVAAASFRNGQQVVLESLEDYNKRAVTLVDGQPVLVWLEYFKLLRPLGRGENPPPLVKIVSARYGPPDAKGYSVSGAVQALLANPSSGAPEILVSDALLSPAMAQRMNRSVATRQAVDPATGEIRTYVPRKVLTVTYSINGVEKTRQFQEGETAVFD
jgi:hypothetical protein